MQYVEGNEVLQNGIYVKPKVAFEKINDARANRQPVYIYGATGIGKTCFIKNYLWDTNYYYISAKKSRDINIDEISKDSEFTVVVIDDLNYVDEEDKKIKYKEIINELLDNPNVWLIMSSRGSMAKWLKIIYINYNFKLISEYDLRFGQLEIEAYFSKAKVGITASSIEQIIDEGQGNPLYTKLLALRFKEIKSRDIKDIIKLENNAIEKAKKDFYDFLEMHVYEQWDERFYDFMMKISILDSFTVDLAFCVTQEKEIGKILSKANEIGSFLEERQHTYDVEYVLRTAMILSMRRKLRQQYNVEYVRELYRRAARYYLHNGNICQALSMFEQSNDYDEKLNILIQNAKKHPGIGYYWELREHYFKLQDEVILQYPELMAGMSMVNSIMMNEEESEKYYKELQKYSKKYTGVNRKKAKELMIWLDVGLPHRSCVDIIKIMKNADVIFSKGFEINFGEVSLTNNEPTIMNGGKDFCEWSKIDKELASTIGKIIEKMLGKFGKGLVNIALAESFMEKGVENSYAFLHAERGRLEAESCGKKESVFASVGTIVWLCLIEGRYKDAMDMLDNFEKSVSDYSRLRPGIESLRLRLMLYRGDTLELMKWMEKAPNEDIEFCALDRYHYMLKARIYIAIGKLGKAAQILGKMIFYAEKINRTYIKIESELLMAIVFFRMGDKNYKNMLLKALEEAEEYHFVRIITREGGAILKLLQKCNYKWKDEKFKQQVMEECTLMASMYPAYLEEKQEGEDSLSENGMKILKMQAEGYSVDKIAKILNIAQSTVKYHCKENYRKLGVNGKAAAVSEAQKRKLI